MTGNVKKSKESEVPEAWQTNGYHRVKGQVLYVEDVIHIYAMLSCKVPLVAIAKHFNISVQMVTHIRSGRRWSWVRDELMREELFDKKLHHEWVPDANAPGEFVCKHCYIRYSQQLMNKVCPIRQNGDDPPLYLTWQQRTRAPIKYKEFKTSVPAADLKKVRKWEKSKARQYMEWRIREYYYDIEKQKRKTAREQRERAKEERRQELIRQVEELRRREALNKLTKAKNSPPSP